MSVEKLLEYGLAVAVIFGLLAPLLWQLLQAVLKAQERIVETQDRITSTLDNHLSAIARSLAVVEERLRLIDEGVRRHVRPQDDQAD